MGELKVIAVAEHEARKRSPARTKSAFEEGNAPNAPSSLVTFIPFSFARDLQLEVTSATLFDLEALVDSGEKPTLVEMEEFGETTEDAEE